VLADLQQLEQTEEGGISTTISQPNLDPPQSSVEPPPPPPSETTIISSSPAVETQTVGFEPEPLPSNALDPEFVELCQRELAYFIGPMAELVIEEAMEQSLPRSPQELVEILAAEIPDFREAREFKERVFS